jgi:hypothetical protein
MLFEFRFFFFFFLRNRGHQLYIYLHIFYFKLDLRSLMEYRSIECIAAYNCLALHQTVQLHREGTGSTSNDHMVVEVSCAALPKGRRASNHLSEKNKERT